MKGVALNIGANSSTPGGRGPIYGDGSFRYVPIPESDDLVMSPTYTELGLDDIRPAAVHDTVAHFDPEFPEMPTGQAYTYGDRHAPKTTEISKLEARDVLFFYATLTYAGSGMPEYDWINDDWGAYIIGHFVLRHDPLSKQEYHALAEDEKERVASNAHARRDEFDAEYLVVGDSEESRLYDLPVPLSDRAGGDPNRIVVDLSTDSGAGPWFKRPLPFDEAGTRTLLEAQSTGVYDGLLDTKEFLDFPEAQSFAQFVSLSHERYLLWQLLNQVTKTREEKLLGSFVYIAGGNNQEVVRKVLDAGTTLEEVVANRPQLQDTLNDLYRSEDLKISNHRKYLGTYTAAEGKGGDVMEAVETFYNNVDPSLEEFLGTLQADDTDGFDVGLARLRRGVASYGRLTAFDQLELWQQLLNLDWLAPSILKKSYVSTAGPKRGFKKVFGTSMDALSDKEVNARLQSLHDFGVEQLNMNPSTAAYELESALCNYQKESDDLDEDSERESAEPC